MISPLRTQLLSAFDDQRLQLFILPTEKCNFRCTYCYERFDVGRMSPETVRGVKALIDSRAEDLRYLSLEWFGGEPLLAKPVIYDICSHATSVASEAGIDYTSGMTTNGYLLDHETIETLSDLGVRSFQISLDGPADTHDTTRLRADGSGTFDRIWKNLLEIQNTNLPVRITLRLHFTPITVPTLKPLIESINNYFAGDPRFTVVFKAIRRMGGAHDDDMPIFSSDAELNARRQLESLLDNRRQIRSLESVQICYAAKPNSLLIRADGRVGKCTVALYDDANTIGTLSEDGKLRIDNEKLRPWMNGFETMDLDQLGCPLQKLHSITPAATKKMLPLIVEK